MDHAYLVRRHILQSKLYSAKKHLVNIVDHTKLMLLLIVFFLCRGVLEKGMSTP